MKKREPGFYWVLMGGQGQIPVVARWTGEAWSHGFGLGYARVRKVLSGRLVPPGKGGIPLPLENVLLEEPGKSYRTALRILKSNHATGTIYVARH